MPAMIVSKGNPGTGGNVIGAVTEIELDVIKAVVGERMTVVTTAVMSTTVGCATVVVELCEVIVVLLLVELVV